MKNYSSLSGCSSDGLNIFTKSHTVPYTKPIINMPKPHNFKINNALSGCKMANEINKTQMESKTTNLM